VAGASIALVVGSCASPTKPTTVPPVTPPPTPDPPKVTCPAPQTVQSPDGLPAAVEYGSATAINGQPPVTTVCAPATGSRFPIGQTTVTCTATDTLQRVDTCTLAVTVTAPPKLTATSFLAFGDSITWGEDGTNAISSSQPLIIRPAVQLPQSQIYPNILQQELAARYRTQSPTVANAGKPGEAVTDSSTFPRFVGLTSSQRYTAVLIMEGTNDIANRDDRVEPAVIFGLQQMVRDAKSRGIRPYLATIPPQNQMGFRGLAWSLVPGFNDRVRALAAAEGVTLVDVYQGFNNDVTTLIGFDGLHPTAEGYTRIADVFFARIKETLEAPPPLSTTSIGRPAALPTRKR